MTRAQQLFALARRAAGGDAWDKVVTIQFTGTISAGGLRGPYEQWVELDSGRSMTCYTLGPASAARGFDGVDSWQRGATGEVLVQDSTVALQAAATEAYVNGRAYWCRGAPAGIGAVEVDTDGEADGEADDEADDEADGGRDGAAGAHAVRVVPAGGQAVALWLDPVTDLLERTVQNIAGTNTSKRWSDYRPVGGLLLPHRSVCGNGDARYLVVVAFDRVVLDPCLPDKVFDMPALTLDDFHLVGAAACASVPVELANHHLYLRCTIKGVALRLMLDTGGVNLLTPEAARRVGLAVAGAFEGRGPGARAVDAGFARAGRLTLGGLVLDAPVLTLPLAGQGATAIGSVAGNIGGDLLRRFVVTFDYARKTVSLAPTGAPAPFDYDRSGMWINRVADAFVVEAVLADGPAARAGLLVGERIESVDGEPSAALTLAAVRARLRAHGSDTPVALGLARAGATVDVALHLRDLIGHDAPADMSDLSRTIKPA